MKKIFGAAVVVLIVEVLARAALGLGDPPLYIADPRVEYMAAPGTYHRFGKLSAYNSFSMRSREVSAKKTDPDELRVLVIGDSVVNAGVQTDQSEVATTLLEERLRAHRPAFVGNVAAGSWGPPNMLAYVQRFGFFDADVVVIVLNSGDEADVPTFDVVDRHPDYPSVKPLLALEELVGRYGMRYMRGAFTKAGPPAAISPADREAALGALRELIRAAKPRHVIVAQHLGVSELGGHEEPGYFSIKSLAASEAARVVTLPLQPPHYRDGIHTNAAGQKVIADALTEEITKALGLAPLTATRTQ